MQQLRPRLRIGHLARHQAGVQRGRFTARCAIGTGLRLIVSWQLIAVIGNRRFVGSLFLAALGDLGFVFGLGLGNLVIAYRRFVIALLGHYLIEAAALPARGLQRLVHLRGTRTRRLAQRTGLQQRIRCDRH
ncbi:hypothetical protein D3C78_490230 [compost metagenome]